MLTLKMYITVIALSVAAWSHVQATKKSVTSTYFQNKLNDNNIEIFIKNYVHEDGVSNKYGLFIVKPPAGGALARVSIYKIEELENGVQYWLQVIQTRDHLLSVSPSQDPVFVGRMFRSPGKHPRLELVPQELGKKLGFGKKIDAWQHRGKVWSYFQPRMMEFVEPNTFQKISIDITRNSISDSNVTELQSVAGAGYMLPGMALVRQMAVDLEAIDGVSLDRKIQGVLGVIYERDQKDEKKVARRRFRLLYISLPAGVQEKLSSTSLNFYEWGEEEGASLRSSQHAQGGSR